MKVLVQDGFGLSLCARRLCQRRFADARRAQGAHVALTSEQLQALSVGLPWERLEEYGRLPTYRVSSNTIAHRLTLASAPINI